MLDIRAAVVDDALAVARVHVRSWKAAYAGLMPDAYLASLRAEERAKRYDFSAADPVAPFTIVALDGASISGFATIGASTDAQAGDVGELMALYVDPDAWRTGVGRALVRRARGELLRRGFSVAVLWVLAGNERAMRFYERDGWSLDGRRRKQTIWGIEVDEVGYRRRLDDRSESE